MNKKIYKYEDIKEEILKAVDLISDPIKQTLSPKGNNVLYEDDKGEQFVTNDGVTIAKNISVKNPIHNAVIEVIKQPSLQVNRAVGDGTSTNILLSQVLIKEGSKLIDDGMNRMQLKEELVNMGEVLKKRLKKYTKNINTPEDIHKLAKISANNDEEIAKNVSRVIEVAGTDGMVFLEHNVNPETELIEDTGFNIDSGLLPELANNGFSTRYDNVPVLVTDKRIYYKQEAETILKVAIKAGWRNVVIIARDFIGESINYFIANHGQTINILLVKEPECTEKDNTAMRDLATYLGGNLITEKKGKLVDNLDASDFVFAKKVVSNPLKTVVVTNKPDNKELGELIGGIRKELKKDTKDKELRKRLARLTKGSVTVKVGGHTPIETQEKLFRYEDAVNATRSAIEHGYTVGGGLSLYACYNEKDHTTMRGVARKLCEASIRQIAINCGKHEQTVLDKTETKKYIGYNAKTDKFEDLLEAGVIDPYKVTEMAIDNSISIATHLLTSGYLIINDIEEDEQKRK